MTRPTKAVEYIRYNFSDSERLSMGAELAAAHQRAAQVDDEAKVITAQIKERKAQVELTVSTLSRKLSDGWEMRNVECRVEYDSPNPFEVSLFRIDNGALVKTRPMNESERQQDLPLEGENGEKVVVIPPAQAEKVAAESAENIKEFFSADHEETKRCANCSGEFPAPQITRIEEFDLCPGCAEQAQNSEYPEPAPAENEAASDPEPEPAAEKTEAQPDYMKHWDAAVKLAQTQHGKRLTASRLQRELKIGYSTAVKLLDRLEAQNAYDAAPEMSYEF